MPTEDLEADPASIYRLIEEHRMLLKATRLGPRVDERDQRDSRLFQD